MQVKGVDAMIRDQLIPEGGDTCGSMSWAASCEEYGKQQHDNPTVRR